MVVAAATSPGLPGRLGMLRDTSSGLEYLIDRGSAYSILPFFSRHFLAGRDDGRQVTASLLGRQAGGRAG